MRGRKPKPSVLRILQGNPGHRPVNTSEPEPASLEATCPDELTSDPVAAQEWMRGIVPAIEIGQITSADRVLAIAHCTLWSTWRSQLDAAAAAPHIVASGPNGYAAPNPARGMANKTLIMLAKIDSELGFSPTSRTRVQAKPRARSAPSRVEQQKAEYR